MKTITNFHKFLFLFFVVSLFSHNLNAENIKAVKFIHNSSIKSTKVILNQAGNLFFENVYSTVQTIEMWVNITGSGVLYSTKSNFVGDPTNSSKAGGFEIMLESGGWARATFCVGDGGLDIKWINMQTVAGQWTHYAFVINNTNLKVYKNGLEIVNQNFMGSIAKGTGDLVLGMNPNWVDGEKFQGMITDFRIWTKALTPSEISSNKDVYLTSSQPSLFLNWTMQEGTGLILNNLVDITNNKGTIVNVDDTGTTGIEWADNSGCPILAASISTIINSPKTDLNVLLTNCGNSLQIKAEQPLTLKIYSINGRLCIQKTIVGNQEVDLSQLPKGCYTLIGGNYCEKFIK